MSINMLHMSSHEWQMARTNMPVILHINVSLHCDYSVNPTLVELLTKKQENEIFIYQVISIYVPATNKPLK